MKQFLLPLLLLPFYLLAQDNIKLTDGSVFNCKVISVDKDQVVFTPDSSTGSRKVPRYMVAEINYNSRVTVSSIQAKDSIIHNEGPLVASPTPVVMHTITESSVSAAKPFFIIGVLGSAVAIGSAIGMVSLKEPKMPTYNGDMNKYLDEVGKYSNQAQDYHDSYNALLHTTLITSSISLLSTTIGGIILVSKKNTEQTSLSFYQKGSSISLCYRF